MDTADILERKMAFIILYLLIHFNCVIGMVSHWKANKAFDGKIPNQSQSIDALNLIHCSRLCSDIASCSSFFHKDEPQRNCFLLDHIITSVECLNDMPSARYFTLHEDKEDDAISLNTTPFYFHTTPAALTLGTFLTTTTTSFPCPDIYKEFSTLIDGTEYFFRVSSTTGNFFVAAAACKAEGGFLARVTTLLKLTYLDTLLTHCQTYSNNYIRIDGTNVNATDFENSGQWLYSDSSQAVMHSNILSGGSLLLPSQRHCLVINLNDKIQDYNCDSTADTYVCEYVVPT